MPDRPAHPMDTLAKELNNAVHHYGVQAHDLFNHLPTLVDLLSPATGGSDDIITPERAIASEELIRNAISAVARYNDEKAEALLIILGLKHDPAVRRVLKARREEAGRLLDVSVQTFRKKYEKELLSTLAFEIWRIQRNNTQHAHEA